MSKGFIKRIVPFLLALTLGLFISGLFIKIMPSFRGFRRGEHRKQHFMMLKQENDRLRMENMRLKMETRSGDADFDFSDDGSAPRLEDSQR